jgi:hypothetical protein
MFTEACRLLRRVSQPFTRVRPIHRDGPRLGVPDWLRDELRLDAARMDRFNRILHGPRTYEGSVLEVLRCDRRGREYVQSSVQLERNTVHAQIVYPDGTVKDLGRSQNLLTNIGRDWWAQQWGFIGAGVTTFSPASAVSTSAVTGTGTPLTASNLATPQLGVAGLRVFMPVTGVTTAPVYANIISNTTSVLTIDQWWTVADAVGTTPGATNALQIAPGGIAACRFMALTTDAAAAAAADTVLATENTTNSVARSLATYAHTYGNSTLTLQKTWSPSGTITALHKAGLFSSLTQGGTTAALGGPMIYETVLNVDATVASGDTLQVTWTGTLSG